MKKKVFKLLRLLSLTVICISLLSSSIIFASENTITISDQFDISNFYSDKIIGGSDGLSKNNYGNTLPNFLTLDWDATENGIYLRFNNFGLDSIDNVSGTISTGNLSVSFSYDDIRIGNNEYYKPISIQTCTESITIKYSASDGGDSFGSQISTGSRSLPSDLINKWSFGTYSTREGCLNYHYRTHGAEVGALQIGVYVRLADFVRTNIIQENLNPIRVVNGITPNVYRYEWNTFYLHVAHGFGGIPTGDLVSFGLKW